jgi:hypothetical protein
VAPGPGPWGHQVTHAHMLPAPRAGQRLGRYRQAVNAAQADGPTWGGRPLAGRHNGGQEVGPPSVGSHGGTCGQEAMLVP